jgi:alpha-galactosidase/6-phospho-beta-glucosidase family protein
VTQTQHPKMVLLGAGSLFFGRQAIWQMVHSPHLNTGTLALVDTDEKRLNAMATLANKVVAHEGVPLAVEASTKRKDVLPGADFVVLSFAVDTVQYRGLDCEISAKYGVRMCSGDSIGPGGIFRTMRELPAILDCARDVEALCPDAWLINYINPSAINGIALRRYAPQVKSFALCDGLHMPHVKRRYAQRAGILSGGSGYTGEIAAAFDMRIAGVNHFTWMLKAKYEGRDVMPAIAESIRREAATETDGGDQGAKAKFNARIGYALYEAFGYVPTCVAHTKEYLPFWQGRGVLKDAIPPLTLWETEPRYRQHAAMWQQVDDFNSGAFPIGDYMTTFGPDHATDIIENMVGSLGKPFFINTANNGAVPNMAGDAFLELLCDVDMGGPRPLPVGDMPPGLHGLQRLVLDAHELTAEAVARCDYSLLRRAMLVDPLITSIADADAILKELLEAERSVLPGCWFA